jgi:hypothetical protein
LFEKGLCLAKQSTALLTKNTYLEVKENDTTAKLTQPQEKFPGLAQPAPALVMAHPHKAGALTTTSFN